MWNNRAYVENRRYSYGYYFKSKMKYLPLRLLCSLGLGVSVKLSDYLKFFVHTSGQSSEQSGLVEHHVAHCSGYNGNSSLAKEETYFYP